MVNRPAFYRAFVWLRPIERRLTPIAIGLGGALVGSMTLRVIIAGAAQW